jgi:UDP-glucuronate 4-epimerase
MNILVTGGAGFIGSHLVDSLLGDGHSVTIVDNFDGFYDRRLKERNIEPHRGHPRWNFIEADIRDLACDHRGLAGSFDAIVHLAAKAGVRPSIDRPLEYQDVNVKGTQNLLELARTRGITRFIFSSSSSVYGVNPRVPWSEEDHVLQPISPYASTKVSGELLGHVYSYLFGIRFLALRLFTVYGPRQRPDLAINTFVRLMRAGKAISMFGDGSTRRDYTHVSDIVAGIKSALTYDKSAYEVINLGNNQTISLREMIDALEAALGTPARIERRPEQKGDVPQTWARIDKARALLGYQPRITFDRGVGSFIEWAAGSLVDGG